MERLERQLRAADREQHQLLQWALKDFPSDQVEAETKRLNKAKETLKVQKVELVAQVKSSQDTAINLPNLERFIEDMQNRLPCIDCKGKQMALDMLGITVYLDGDNVEVAAILDPGIVLTPSEGRWSLSLIIPPPNNDPWVLEINGLERGRSEVKPSTP